MISYAQNFEDVMLWRALGHVENGFYIDLGAQDPLIDSVSLAFYEHGWTGIHVEPTPHYAQLLRNQRPGDTVIQAAVADGPEILTFFEIPDSGISTADPKIAEQHRERGFNIREITVPCVRLSSIFKTCGKRDIHWLKIDVEGFELSALKSWGKAAARPWIIVVESTLPLTQVESFKNWEPLLLRRGYEPVYFDGLNRYFLSRERAALKQAFSAPPNVFDNFSVNGTASTNLHRHLSARHEVSLAEMSLQVSQAKSRVDEIENSLQARKVEYEAHILESAKKLDSRKDEVIYLEQNRARREEEFGTLYRDQSRQVEALLAQLTVLEKEAAAKFLDWQHKAGVEREQSSARFLERETAMGAQLLANEQRFNQQLDVLRVEATTQNLAIEREVAQKLEIVRRDTEQERRELVQAHAARLSDLRQQLLTREREIAAEVRLLQERAIEAQRSVEAVATQRMLLQSNAHSDEVLNLRKAAQALEKSLREQFESHRTEREQLNAQAKTQTDMHIADVARRELQSQKVEEDLIKRKLALETQLKDMQNLKSRLEQDAYNLRLLLGGVRSSLSWRITAPLRLLRSLFSPSRPFDFGRMTDVMTSGALSPIDDTSPLKTLLNPFGSFNMSINPSMRFMITSVVPPIAANHLFNTDLFTLSDEEFLQNAYRLVFRREIDPGGKSHFLGQLKDGATRILVLSLLRFSSEGNETAAMFPQLDAELAIASGAKAIAATFDELAELNGRAFVRAAYLSLLGREPDASGMESCVSLMNGGAAKVELLTELQRSVEGRSRKANADAIMKAIGLYKLSPETALQTSTIIPNAREEHAVDAAPTITNLLACDEQNFVRRAFWVLLGRWPEPEAFMAYFNLLKTGSKRMQLLADIAASPEAYVRSQLIEHIESAIRRYQISAIPLVGAVTQLFLGPIEKRDRISRDLRAIQFENAVRLDAVEQNTIRSRFEIGEINSTVQELARVALSQVELANSRPADYGLLTPRGRRVFDDIVLQRISLNTKVD